MPNRCVRAEKNMKDGFIKVAACSPKVVLADPKANADAIIAALHRAAAHGVRLAAFPELAIEGLGFAIPSTLAREVIGNLMDYGFVVGRPYLGVSTQDVSLSGYGFFTSAYTYPCIVSVEDGSAAQQAGLKKDDVIMAVNGETVSSSDGLYIAVSKFKVGDTVTLTILRSNSQIDVSVTLGQRSTAKTAE